MKMTDRIKMSRKGEKIINFRFNNFKFVKKGHLKKNYKMCLCIFIGA